MSDPGAEPRLGVQSVDRAIAVLNLYRHGPAELGITEIAKRTELNLSTAHRIVRALCIAQYMEQRPDNDKYRLGPALLGLGQRALQHSGFAAALPILEALAAETGESTSLGVHRGDEVVVVLAAASNQRLRFDHESGSTMDLHASAMGKVLVAFSQMHPEDAVAAMGSLERYTDATITAPAALVAELVGIRATGFAVNREERYTGVYGVAAPVLDIRGLAVAAIGLQGPTVRLAADSFERIGHRVRRAADAVAAMLG